MGKSTLPGADTKSIRINTIITDEAVTIPDLLCCLLSGNLCLLLITAWVHSGTAADPSLNWT